MEKNRVLYEREWQDDLAESDEELVIRNKVVVKGRVVSYEILSLPLDCNSGCSLLEPYESLGRCLCGERVLQIFLREVRERS